MAQLTSILGNSQKLDGGAMFGNAPKAVWEKWIPADELNRIPLACRALLLQTDNAKILFETGIGQFFDPKLRERYGVVETEHCLLTNLKAQGLEHSDIDAVVLSHLHFDHAGGLLSSWQPDEKPELLFPNAEFYVGEAAWERAQNPHFRDRASFIPDLNRQLEASGRLRIVTTDSLEIKGQKIRFHISEGHTPGMLISEIVLPGSNIYFCADLIPASPWVHMPITMGYDRFPERLIDEKQRLLERVKEQDAYLYFTHDHHIAMAKVAQDERGRYHTHDALPELEAWVA